MNPLLPAKNVTQGYVLITVLLAFMLTAALVTVTLSLSTSEIGQSGNNLAVARVRAAAEAAQADTLFYMTNQGLDDVNAVLDTYATRFAYSNGDASSTPVINPSDYATVLASLNARPGTKMSGSANNVNYTSNITYTGMDVDESSYSSSGQTYVLNYTAVGQGVQSAYKRSVTTDGQLQIRLGRQYLNQFVLLADDGGSTQGNFYATGMDYDGPVHINKNWRFAGKPTFKYGATTAAKTVEMSKDCNPSKQTYVSTQSYGCTAPDWNGNGLKYQADPITLPVNAQSQQRAALGLDANDTSTLTNNKECLALGANFSSCGSAAIPEDVYIPRDSSGKITGGIYIKGNAKSIIMSAGGNQQTYLIKNSKGVEVSIVVDYSTNTTRFIKNNVTMTLSGVINGDSKGAGKSNGMIYCTGTIESLGGPGRDSKKTLSKPAPAIPDQQVIPPAVATNSAINIAAASDIIIQNDLIYQQDPRINASAKNVLGLMAGTGNVRIGTAAPNDIYVQAALLAGANGKGFAVDSYSDGRLRGQIHMMGSLAESVDPARGVGALKGNDIVITSGYGDAFNFDPRFLNGGAVPPYFPSTKKFAAQSVWPNQQGWREN